MTYREVHKNGAKIGCFLCSARTCTPGRRSRVGVHSATLSTRADFLPQHPYTLWLITEPMSPASNLTDLCPWLVILQCFLFPSPNPLQTGRVAGSGSSKLNPTHSWPAPATLDPTPHHSQEELSSYHQLEESFMSSLTEYIALCQELCTRKWTLCPFCRLKNYIRAKRFHLPNQRSALVSFPCLSQSKALHL